MKDLTVSEGDGHVPTARQSVLMLVTNDMVRLYKDLFGRGPTRAWSGWANPDTLICTLEDSLTASERKMVELGEHQKLREARMFFQHASDDEFVAVAEEATGRKVRSFVSGIDTGRDVSSEVFYFEPEKS